MGVGGSRDWALGPALLGQLIGLAPSSGHSCRLGLRRDCSRTGAGGSGPGLLSRWRCCRSYACAEGSGIPALGAPCLPLHTSVSSGLRYSFLPSFLRG